MKEELCQAFCGALILRDVPVGQAVGTGFRQPNGDAVGFYIVYDVLDKSRARLEDCGLTVPDLMASGIDVMTGTRAVVFNEMLSDAHAHYDADQCVIHTDFMSIKSIPSAALAFVALLIRIEALMLLSPEKVEATFREDASTGVHQLL